MTDPIQEIAVEIAKQLPVKEAYTDAASPVMKQIGGAAESIAKTLRLALLPFEIGGAYFDRVKRLIDESVSRVPEDKRSSPDPQILGPVVEGVKYVPDSTPISDMFSELLSKAFDQDQSRLAHPSYPAIIRQLSADEAVLLRLLWTRKVTRQGSYRRQWTMDWIAETHQFHNQRFELDEFPREIMGRPDDLSFYIEHLYALGLAAVHKDKETSINSPDGTQIGTRATETLQLTPMGVRFMAAVSPSGGLAGGRAGP